MSHDVHAMAAPAVAVVIPTYKPGRTILKVIRLIGSEVSKIYVVDDCCPEKSGDLVERESLDPRVRVIRHETNQGVGGAVITGYRAAIDDGMEIAVKIDSDGQMDPALIPHFVYAIHSGHADYAKGNRFFDIESIRLMPRIRLFGNAVLSIMAKFSSGYWNIFDPTNGYTAIHCDVAKILPLHKVNRRYFFETDMLFNLGLYRAVVWDIPMHAHYDEETSGIKISRVVGPFLFLHAKKFLWRIMANYFFRDFSFASLCLIAGSLSLSFGVLYGSLVWVKGITTYQATPTGTIMIITLSIILGMQLLLAFFAADTASVPRNAIHVMLPSRVIKPLKQFVDKPETEG